jgi:hypothetical protein
MFKLGQTVYKVVYTSFTEGHDSTVYHNPMVETLRVVNVEGELVCLYHQRTGKLDFCNSNSLYSDYKIADSVARSMCKNHEVRY